MFSKVHVPMITPRCLASVTYAYPILSFNFSDGVKATLNVETLSFTPAPPAV